MRDDIKDLLVSLWVYGAGLWTRILFDQKKKYTKAQIAALACFGVAIILVVRYFKLPSGYSVTIGLLGGVWLPNLVSVLIKAGDKSEDKAVDKISKKITDNIP